MTDPKTAGRSGLVSFRISTIACRSVRATLLYAGPDAEPESTSGRSVTYRELRNTPGRIWERLANDQPLTLVADGEAKAIVIPVRAGDSEGALEAFRRGQAMMAVAEIRKQARETGASKLTLSEINAVIDEVRRERIARERSRER